MKRVELGRLFLVRNKEKNPAANSDYVFVLLEGGKGVKPYLFTDTQIRVARERAASCLAEVRLLWRAPGRPASRFAFRTRSGGLFLTGSAPGDCRV